MKRFLLTLWVLMFTTSVLIGCGLSNSDKQTKPINKELLLNSLKQDLQGSKNVKVLLTKPFREKNIVLYSFDLPDGHYVEHREFAIDGERIKLYGREGGIAKTNSHQLISVSSSGSMSSSDGTEPYFICFGEIYNNQVKKIEIIYSDGHVETVPVEGTGYLAIYEEAVPGVKTVKAFGDGDKVLYKIP